MADPAADTLELPVPTGREDDGVVHVSSDHDGLRALCGTDISAMDWCEYSTPTSCVVCAALETDAYA